MEKSIDLTFLNGFTGGNQEKRNKYINMFLQQGPALLNSVSKNLEEKNWQDLKVAAHSLKPQLKFMGVKELEQVVLTIETYAGNESNLEELPQLCNQLADVCKKVFDELKAETAI